MSKEINIDNEEEILKECDFDYYYDSEVCSRELCMFYNDVCNKAFMNTKFNDKQAKIDLGRIGIILNKQHKQIADLEAKLEQSQKEKELDNAFWKQECDSLQKALSEKEKEIEEINREFVQSTHDWKEIVKEKIQAKTDFAIEQLEKIINIFEPYENEEKDTILCANNGVSFLEYVEDKIKELKEKTNVKN